MLWHGESAGIYEKWASPVCFFRGCAHLPRVGAKQPDHLTFLLRGYRTAALTRPFGPAKNKPSSIENSTCLKWERGRGRKRKDMKVAWDIICLTWMLSNMQGPGKSASIHPEMKGFTLPWASTTSNRAKVSRGESCKDDWGEHYDFQGNRAPENHRADVTLFIHITGILRHHSGGYVHPWDLQGRQWSSGKSMRPP